MRSEPAEVWLNDGRPARFVWRGRLFTVLSVIERPPTPDPVSAPEGDAGLGPARSAGGAGGVSGEAGAVMRCWRVTASAGKNVPPDTYRLCQDSASGRWLLSRDGR
ncbi:MAG TPA: DUF6504 family protein [Streptosporangiaceae bacterium]